MNSEYVTIGSPAIKVVEECSEVIHIICKAEQFGLDSWHPKDALKVPNRELIRMEIADLKLALDNLERVLSGKSPGSLCFPILAN